MHCIRYYLSLHKGINTTYNKKDSNQPTRYNTVKNSNEIIAEIKNILQKN